MGILSVREDAEQTGSVKILEKERFSAGVPVIVAEFFAPRETLERKRKWQKRRLYRLGKKFLHRLGADVVVPTVGCGNALGIPVEPTESVEYSIEPQEMENALETVLAGYHQSPDEKTGWVMDGMCSPVSATLLIGICQKVRYPGIVTHQPEKAERLEEMLFREYGANLEICRELPWKESRNCILADVDGGRILLDGRVIIDGKKMALDLHGYPVDQGQLLRQYPQLGEVLTFREWCVRKSG